jgi:hypothetical protein
LTQEELGEVRGVQGNKHEKVCKLHFASNKTSLKEGLKGLQ